MRSSMNGVSRGQLRPHFGGRGLPFITCGLVIVLVILGYSYWNLSFRFNILQQNAFDLEDRVKINAKKNELLSKQNEELNEKLQMNKASLDESKKNSAKRQAEADQLSSQLRHKEEEVKRLNSQIETLKNDADKCKEYSDDLFNQLENAKGKLKELENEISLLKEKNFALEQTANKNEENEIKGNKISNPKFPVPNNQIQVENQNKPNLVNEPNQNEKADMKNEIADPDIDAPPNLSAETH